MTIVAVRCEGSRPDGWTCTVALRDGSVDISTHRVRVRPDDLELLAPAAVDPVALVEESFRFLLDRESPQMILAAFDLLEIGRYFPEYEAEIRRRMRGLG